jgi:glycerol-3-phosphate dehydrogenase
MDEIKKRISIFSEEKIVREHSIFSEEKNRAGALNFFGGKKYL